jgi:hypothetical protein
MKRNSSFDTASSGLGYERHLDVLSAEGAKYAISKTNIEINYRAPSALLLMLAKRPGPMGRAFTFRAFGADSSPY